ncbi:unnamed protein product [Ostreobium quekettii]|uniref:Uncharacterized protein n=1 Tax=Ostreobium quekettii TaxID=121088 RepID=A0A8S1IUX0_9CHLO|nr:unnamed protein product [Ostreobium quekettii]|eukprot:evm.model.scf_1012.1 EVM.evm.TU.scf_1012.1   scf_1012:4525-6822(+)
MVAANVGTALALTCLGATGTAVGGAMVVAQPDMSFERLGFLQGVAAGLMLAISVMDLLPGAMEAIGFGAANLCFYVGVAFFALVVVAIPEPSLEGIIKEDDSSKGSKKWRREVLFSGLITALGITLHNFPEGVSVYLASMKSSAMGASLAVAIALHNVPEGIAVALPVFFATKSRWEGFKYAAVSGMAEPLAVVVMGLIFPVDLSPDLIQAMLAGVGGIMAFLSFHELMPLAFQHAGRRPATAAVFLGMAVMSGNLYLVDHWLGLSH